MATYGVILEIVLEIVLDRDSISYYISSFISEILLKGNQ